MLNPIKYMAAMLLTFISSAALAIPSSSLTGNGVIWTLSVDAKNANQASFTLSADVGGATLDDAYLHEFSLKNFGSSASISNLSAPAGTWAWQNEGLAATGCKDNGTYDALCVYNTSDFMDAPSTASDFLFSFDITLDVDDLFPELVHFKVRWVAADDNHRRRGAHDDDGFTKVGGLISDNFHLGYVPPVTDEIPEPAILGLLVIGLSGMVALRKLKR